LQAYPIFPSPHRDLRQPVKGTEVLRPNLLLTSTEAARRVGAASTLRLLAHAKRGKLRIAGQTEDGRVLFREAEVLRTAQEMPARDLIDPDNRDLPPGLLPCGCCWAPPTRIGENRPPEGEPEFLCPEARGLDLARRLAAAFVLAAPGDLFLARLAVITREAFERHIGIATAPSGRDDAQ
jgi:hypothetical protein